MDKALKIFIGLNAFIALANLSILISNYIHHDLWWFNWITAAIVVMGSVSTYRGILEWRKSK